MFQFENDGPWFHVPIRCDRMSLSGVDLCGYCVEREKKTIEKLRDIRGTTIGGTLPSYLMGRVIEPIPYWSRLYGGAWFNLKIQEGYTISAETMAKIQMKLDAAYGGIITVPPEPMPNGVTGKKGRRPKAAVAVAVATAPAPAVAAPAVAAPAPVVALTVPSPTPPPAPAAKKRQAKKATATATAAATASTPTTATAFVPNPETSEEVDDILTIPVRKTTVDGRDLYLDAAKDKLYDLKFKYLGRLKEGAIVAHPDSDAE
jgi:hypothetical protein